MKLSQRVQCLIDISGTLTSTATPQVSDNSGAKLVQCIQKSGTQWTIGDIITVAVKKARGTKV